MIYVDSMGQWEMVELNGEMMLIPRRIRQWPADDTEFLGLAKIKAWDFADESWAEKEET